MYCTGRPRGVSTPSSEPRLWVYSSFIGPEFQVCILYLLLDTLGAQDAEGAGNCLTFTQTSMARQDHRGTALAKQGQG